MVDYIEQKTVFGKMPKRIEESNKSTFGKILNIAGSRNYIGAAYLSSIAALKVGAGYVTLASIDNVINAIVSDSPEITFQHLNMNEEGSISSNNTIKDLQTYNVVSIGCGISNNEDTKHFVFETIGKLSKVQKLVLDADGINILSNHKGEISLKNSVITPHPGELARLLNVPVDEIINNREMYARITAQTYECTTVLKGHNSIITDGEKIYINKTGSSALAKAGSGDVLTGIIAGLLAQHVPSIDAAILGVYLHGLAGDIAAEDLTKYSVLASDIINYLPFAISEILDNEE